MPSPRGAPRAMTHVYLLQSLPQPTQHYVGLPRDVAQRLAEHNAGKAPQQQSTDLGGSSWPSASRIMRAPSGSSATSNPARAGPSPRGTCGRPCSPLARDATPPAGRPFRPHFTRKPTSFSLVTVGKAVREDRSGGQCVYARLWENVVRVEETCSSNTPKQVWAWRPLVWQAPTWVARPSLALACASSARAL